MGCSGEAQKIKDKMMLMKLARMEIQMAKEKELKKLSEIEGHPVTRSNIPDYIDPDFARENNIATDYKLINNKDNIEKKIKDEKKTKKEKPKKEKKDKKENKGKKSKNKTLDKKNTKPKKKK